MATILCVDDEPSVGVILEHTLAKMGHRPLLVSSVDEAMQTVLRSPLDLIIADYRMPKHTGLDLLPIKVDVRLIATTNRDLRAEVDAGKFRSDLYYRLNVVPIRTPSLRDRADDIPRLVRHFVQRTAEHQGVPPPTIAPETMHLLQHYRWPGNVRELANAIERAVILCRGTVLPPSAFDEYLRDGVPAAAAGGGPAPAPVAQADPMPYDLDAIERKAIERALAATGGNRTRAAKLLGISERTLRNKLNTPRVPTES